MSSHKICFGVEIAKIITSIIILSGPMTSQCASMFTLQRAFAALINNI